MNSFAKTLLCVASVFALSACTRIETGEIGLRINASKQVEGSELSPGSWNQTFIGDVLTFPVRDIAVKVVDKKPITADNSALGDFDMTVIYTINPSAVSDLWGQQSRSFHLLDHEDDNYLMFNYVTTLANNAAYKAVREFKALEVNDKRQLIEEKIKSYVSETLNDNKLGQAITITTVQVTGITPAQSIIDSANAVVKAENELRVKQTEVQIAAKEAERMTALSANGGQSIAYMQAQSQLLIAQGIKEGKVNTIVVPMDFKGMVNIK